jgi:WD40 repeat protein
MRRLARFLLRWIAPVAAVAAVWVAWWVISQLPLKVVRTNTLLAIRSLTSPALNSESIVYSGVPVGSQVFQPFEVDLKAGRSTPIPAESGRTHRCAPDLSWVAWESSDTEITIADLPGVRPRFRIPIPGGGKLEGGLAGVAVSPNSRLIGIYDKRDKSWEIWDVQDRKRISCIVGTMSQGAISFDGTRFASPLSRSNTIGVWALPSGDWVGEVPIGGTLDSVAFAPDGGLLIGCEAGTVAIAPTAQGARPPLALAEGGRFIELNKDYQVKFRLVSQDLVKTCREFQCVFPFPNTTGRRLPQFSADGRHLGFLSAKVGLLWDITSDPPRCLDADIGLAVPHDHTATIEFNSVGQTMTLNNQGTFRLMDRATLQTKVEVRPGPDSAQARSTFSPSGRWMTSVEAFDASSLPRWKQHVQSLVRQHTGIVYSHLVTVYDAETGAVVHRVPGGDVIAWPADGSTLWTDDSVSSTNQSALAFRQWPIHAPRPPIWLWAGTGVVAAAMLLRLLRALRGRPVAIAGAPR